MDRWSALSMIESADEDHARGRAGELSRFQIKPAEWHRSVGGARVSPTNPQMALGVAQRIMAERAAAFQRTHGRGPTDFEFYILWNAPAQVDRPSRVVARRARRYCNLVAREEPGQRRAQSVGQSGTGDFGVRPAVFAFLGGDVEGGARACQTRKATAWPRTLPGRPPPPGNWADVNGWARSGMSGRWFH